MLDSVDYAANAGVVPAIACMGDQDVFFEAHQIMAEAMRKEGLQLVNLISPGTGHKIDPITHREQMRLIGAFAAAGLDHAPRKLRFVTWTLKYSSCHWLRVLGLKRHYERAELAAALNDDGSIEVDEPTNVTAFALTLPGRWATPSHLRIGGKEVKPLMPPAKSGSPIILTLQKGTGSHCQMRTADRLTTANVLAYKARSTTPSQRPSCACEAQAVPGTRPHRLGPTPTCSASTTSGTATFAANCRSRTTST